MNSTILTTAALLLTFALVSCGGPSAPKAKPVQTAKVVQTKWKSVTLHFKGFKKTKSGAT